MVIVFSTACLERVPDQASALARLLAADLAPIELGALEGLVEAPAAGIQGAHMAFLPAQAGRVNLAAADDDLRRKDVRAVCEALARCQWLGIPRYQVDAGWNLDQTLSRNAHPVPESLPAARRPHALAQLERSLERLASEALDRGLELGVVNMAPLAGGLLAGPAEIRQVLRTVAAPNLKLSLSLGALAEAARHAARPAGGQAARHAGRFDPDEAAAGLRDLACAVRVPPWSAKPETWISRVCAALDPLPLTLETSARDAAHLRRLAADFAEHLHATA